MPARSSCRFSPIRDGLPVDVDGVYIGGGYPELHAAALSENDVAKSAIRTLAAEGAPVYGECGGLMYLAERMKVGGDVFPMCGVLPFGTRIPAGLALSYVEIHTRGGLFGSGRTVRGHMYHHSMIDGETPGDRCYDVRTPHGEASEEGYHHGNVLASYAHLHFASDPGIASAFVTACEAFRTGRAIVPAGPSSPAD